MFFQKQNRWQWRLRLESSNEPDEKITAIAFKIPATKIMNNLSAKPASKMQTEETDKSLKWLKNYTMLMHIYLAYIAKNQLGVRQKDLILLLKKLKNKLHQIVLYHEN